MQLRPHQQRAFDAMQEKDCGQIIVPTGGGKTYIMIADCLARAAQGSTTVVVAPRILLANQLCEEFMQFVSATWTHVCHAHSGETHHFSSTKPEKIALFANTARAAGESCIIFTTYHSLHRVVESGIDIDTIYYDEAHNATGKHFFKSVFAVSEYAKRRYYFTATPRTGRGVSVARGMNNSDVYGGTLCNVPARELIDAGAIVPPKVVPFETNRTRTKHNAHEVDADNLRDMFEQLDVFQNPKVLVAAPSSKVLGDMLGHTTILEYFYDKGYDVMHITSKFGAIINDKKVGREEFFQTLTSWGADDTRKFVIFHYSILSEGINVPGLTHTILLRNLPIVEMAQTIGRVIRVHKDDRDAVAQGLIPAGAFHLYKKQEGVVTMPTGYKMGDAIAQRLQNVVNAIFIEGIPPLSYC
ncbi:helicase [Synechococcus phage syn9]|uniref:Helicase n=1 Tax=Synechococcus phage syn9 TaxID=382359 RepID=Q0QZF3_BPSYS|nr:helicase [Synechococcus phage syn9]ABA47044.1 helicase [Synechococcus phage syn9]AGH56592.1 helicase [Cyanophage Syn10]